MAAGHSVDPVLWQRMIDELMGRIAGRFARVEPRRRARAFVLGLLTDLPRKNCWSIAEHAGDATPDGMQHLLAGARWDADGVRDDLRGYVAGHLGDAAAVLVVDETGDLKKGRCTAGVQRQYTGTAGRIENCQVAVYLTYAAPGGHALIDRELYLPRSWTGDPARCAAAGIPEGTMFATKPKLARRVIARALDAGIPASWVAGDEVYGGDPGLRADLETRQMGYVLAVAKSHRLNAGPGACRADQLAARLPRSAWQQYSAGNGAKGHRYYDWAFIGVEPRSSGTAGCWSAATGGPGSLPSTGATHPATFPSQSSPGSPAAGGPGRRTSKVARAWPAWMSTRSADGIPGTDGPLWPCWPARSSP